MTTLFTQDIWLLISLAVIALTAGFVHSAIGFGFGIVAVSLVPLVIDVRQAHVVISISSVPVIVAAAWSYRKGVRFDDLKPALVGAAIFLPIGLALFEWLPMDALVRATGVAILAMVVIRLRNRRMPEHDEPDGGGSCFVAGAAGGFLAGAVSIAGPPIAAFALKQNWTPARFKAFVNQFLLLVSIYKVAGLGMRGFLDGPTLVQALWLAPAAIGGIFLGVRVSGRISSLWFERLVAAALVAISLMFIIRGAS